MPQPGRLSARRSKPSYVMAIIGVAFVLLILGLIGWFLINAKQLGDYFKENVEVRAHLSQTYTSQDSATLVNFISTQPYVKSYEFITKEKAKTIYEADGNEDWEKILDHNPLPASVNFKIRSDYATPDSLNKISQVLTSNLFVSDVNYPKSLVANLNNIIRKISIVLLIIAVIICVVVIILIDNTIRLAMFSNRFLIKTMQMVGATRWFIAKPLNIRAIINGAVSAAIAMLVLYLAVLGAESFFDGFKKLHDTNMMILLAVVLILLGIGITVFSTHRSVLKYLRMKLDDLY